MYSFLFAWDFWDLVQEGYGFPGGSDSKESSCNAGDQGLIPGLGKSPGEGNVNPLQHSCLENPMDRGAWWAVVHGVTKCWTGLNNQHARVQEGYFQWWAYKNNSLWDFWDLIVVFTLLIFHTYIHTHTYKDKWQYH